MSVLYHNAQYLVNAINLVVLCCRVVDQYQSYTSNHTHENIYTKPQGGIYILGFSSTKTGNHLSLWETNITTSGQRVALSSQNIKKKIKAEYSNIGYRCRILILYI